MLEIATRPETVTIGFLVPLELQKEIQKISKEKRVSASEVYRKFLEAGHSLYLSQQASTEPH